MSLTRRLRDNQDLILFLVTEASTSSISEGGKRSECILFVSPNLCPLSCIQIAANSSCTRALPSLAATPPQTHALLSHQVKCLKTWMLTLQFVYWVFNNKISVWFCGFNRLLFWYADCSESKLSWKSQNVSKMCFKSIHYINSPYTGRGRPCWNHIKFNWGLNRGLRHRIRVYD